MHSDLGIDHIDMPYTAPKLWAAIQAALGNSQHAAGLRASG
jgi:hypothetical protein